MTLTFEPDVDTDQNKPAC